MDLNNISMYSGKNKRIAVIDTGVALKSPNIHHYMVDAQNTFNECHTSFIKNMHGTYCSLRILSELPEIELYSYCACNRDGEIDINLVKLAIESAIQNSVDVINISLKFDKFSESLYNTCNKAYESNIIIVAASDGNLSYPANQRNVLSVSSQKLLKGNEVFIEFEKGNIILYDKDFTCNFEGRSIVVPVSSSLASAYLSCKIISAINEYPLLSGKMLFRKLLGVELYCDTCQEIADTINPNTLVFDSSYAFTELLKFHSCMNKNIKGYYDISKDIFTDFSGNELLDTSDSFLLEVNSSIKEKNSVYAQQRLHIGNHSLVGNFINPGNYDSVTLLQHKPPEIAYIEKISKPIICICGFGHSSSKFYTQVMLHKQFLNKNNAPISITYNSLGYIFDFKVFKYPEKIILPDLIYSINQDLYLYDSQYVDNDIFIIDIAGGICPINNKNNNNFGKLFDSYTDAANIDIVVLCINQAIDPIVIEREIKRIEMKGIPYIYLVISNECYTQPSLVHSDGVKSVYKNSISEKEFYSMYKEIFYKYPTYFKSDLDSGNLFNDIYKLLV